MFAVDVGYGQLAWQLRQDERVVVLDRTNIRHLSAESLSALPGAGGRRPLIHLLDCGPVGSPAGVGAHSGLGADGKAAVRSGEEIGSVRGSGARAGSAHGGDPVGGGSRRGPWSRSQGPQRQPACLARPEMWSTSSGCKQMHRQPTRPLSRESFLKVLSEKVEP
ncbi:MAG: SAM-dependent methyltransferase [Nocardioidaceae bacterium]